MRKNKYEAELDLLEARFRGEDVDAPENRSIPEEYKQNLSEISEESDNFVSTFARLYASLIYDEPNASEEFVF